MADPQNQPPLPPRANRFRPRRDAIASLARDIRSGRSPRLAMAGLVSIAGLVGFIVSAILLKWGVYSMPLRYLVGLAFGYAALAYGMRHWVEAHPHEITSDLDRAEDNPRRSEPDYSDAADLIPDAIDGEGIVLLVVIAVLFSVVYWLISAAPMLMAELTLDSLVAARVYQRLRRQEMSSYTGTFIRLTWFPLLVLAILLCGAAALIQASFPEAHTLGEAIRLWLAQA